MNDPVRHFDDETMKLGMLMESALAQQKMADDHLQKLKVHTRDLDQVVRGEIRQTLVEEFQSLAGESDRAARALRALQATPHLRGIIAGFGIMIACALMATLIAWRVLPSASSVAAQRAERDVLARNIADLERRGGKIEWRSCGDPGRLCVRIERGAPVYGLKSDYYIVKGY